MTSRMIITYAKVEAPEEKVRLYIREGVTMNGDVEALVLEENSPYEMVAVRMAGEKERRFDLDYDNLPDEPEEDEIDYGDAESEPEAYDMSIEEEQEAV